MFSSYEEDVKGVKFKMIAIHDEHNSCNDFYIGETLVTQELWNAIMDFNPSYFKHEEFLPVECVSWSECQIFIEKLNLLTKRNYRLPFESEWECVARGELVRVSNGIGQNADENINQRYKEGTYNVKTKQPNELGVYDLFSNVFQWCDDLYELDSYGVKRNIGSKLREFHVIKGRYWEPWEIFDDVKWRNGVYIGDCYFIRCGDLGFRLACSRI